MILKSSELASRLLNWYRENRRDLPWRREVTPYRVWISEIMLQQTQIERVIHYFQRWMRAFPTVRAVAEAEASSLLKAWEGLGYYSRVQNIRKTAGILMQAYQGRLPDSHAELLRLPGIGPYTAGAIMSLAFNQPCPAVDGNVERVFARLHDLDAPVKSLQNRNFIHDQIRGMIPEKQAREFNQALMELGALICRPQSPVCSRCPCPPFCLSRVQGTTHLRPVRKKPARPTPLEVAAGVLVHRGRIFIQKRPPSGLMPNLWEFPGGKLKPDETPQAALEREFQEELNLAVTVGSPIMIIRHSYTSFRITLHTFWCALTRPKQRPVLRFAVDGRWVSPPELTEFAFPAADNKLIAHLSSKQAWPACEQEMFRMRIDTP